MSSAVATPVRPVVALDDDRAHRRLERRHRMRMVGGRLVFAVCALVLISMLVFAATQALPGSAAERALGEYSTDETLVAAVERQMGLDRPVVEQYLDWASGAIRLDFGNALANQRSVWSMVQSPLQNSLLLMGVAWITTNTLGIGLGIAAASRRESRFDHVLSNVMAALSAVPGFVFAIGLIFLLATGVFHVFRPVSLIPADDLAWQHLDLLVLPTMALVLDSVSYCYRTTRRLVAEAMQSDYVEMAILKGVPPRRVLLRHAFPNAAAPLVQVLAISALYLLSGIVVIEMVFSYPGIGRTLVSSVSVLDSPMIQCIVMIQAGAFLVVSLGADLLSLRLSPRRWSVR